MKVPNVHPYQHYLGKQTYQCNRAEYRCFLSSDLWHLVQETIIDRETLSVPSLVFALEAAVVY